uniref:E3 ubiquitin-protein ligase n=1 Tax=Macrostomum lignano TaxID=282301 RepID=A0A1I8JE26_9PLAT
EVADQLESSSSPGVDEFLPGSRSPADGSSIELATVSAGDTGDAVRGSVGVEDPMTTASALSAARAAADAAAQFAALGELCAGKVGAGGGTDAEYLRFLYSSDASSSGGGCGDGDSEGSDTGEPAATGTAAAATRTSRRSSTDFYSADSTLTSRCDSSQSEAPPAE